MSIIDNIEFVHEGKKESRDFVLGRARKYLEMVGLKENLKDYPHQLSGGMQQRAGIARALSIDPDILLMDEPLSHLDAMTGKRLREDIVRIWKETGVTVIYVTHDLSEACFLSEKIMLMSKNPARIVKELRVNLSWPRAEDSPEFFRFYTGAARDFESLQENDASSSILEGSE
jgi:NitT/TauT family transport system ATP-binding protein